MGNGAANDRWDVFICHASEDKDGFVRPLAQALRQLEVTVWYDEFSLGVGDSLSEGIDRGIAGSRYGVVVISPAFIGKAWTRHELRGLVNRDVEEDQRILPIWHGVTKDDVRKLSPSLSDKIAIDTRREGPLEAALTLLRIVRRDLYDAHPHAELEKMASGQAIRELQAEIDGLREELSEFQCPWCGSKLISQEHIDYDERSSGVVETFECGYSRGGWSERPCPNDPRFPKLEDYELEVTQVGEGRPRFICTAKPKTEMARRVRLGTRYGDTEEEAKDAVVEHYRYLTTPPGQEFRGRWINRGGYRAPTEESA